MTRCGYRCDLCLAYRPNVEIEPSNQQILSDGWYRYFGFRIEPASILCDGCMAERARLIDQNCPVRACTIERNLANCGLCPDYMCEKFKERVVDLREIQQRIGAVIPIEDYHRFILPYENKRRLDVYRQSRVIIK
ncbi:MAG: DUF3795 domain-containing protein [Acidobacteriaceae bacterium]